jgi:hypothetical protein
MNFLLKTLLKHQMKNVPEDQLNMMIAIVEKNPELFKKIAEEVQQKVSTGMDQQAAALEVVTKYKNEIQEAMK